MYQIPQKKRSYFAFGSVLVFTIVAGCGGGGGGTAEPGNISGGNNAAPVNAASTVGIEVVRSYPRDSQAFTQGLVFHDGGLVESTGLYGQSSLRSITLETGEVLQRVDLPDQFFGEGIAILGDKIYQLSWKEQTGFIYDLATFNLVGNFSYQGEGWGLATDGISLIVSDGTNVIRFLDPRSFQTVRTLNVTNEGEPLQLINELEWVRGEIWANISNQDRIARIDPQTGNIKGWLDLSAIIPTIPGQDTENTANGIAFHEPTGRIFVTGKRWPTLYEITVP